MTHHFNQSTILMMCPWHHTLSKLIQRTTEPPTTKPIGLGVKGLEGRDTSRCIPPGILHRTPSKSPTFPSSSVQRRGYATHGEETTEWSNHALSPTRI